MFLHSGSVQNLILYEAVLLSDLSLKLLKNKNMIKRDFIFLISNAALNPCDREEINGKYTLDNTNYLNNSNFNKRDSSTTMKNFFSYSTLQEKIARFLHKPIINTNKLSEDEKKDLYYVIRDRNYGVYSFEEQEKLRNARIGILGQGCVGELAASIAARIGFGYIRIIDGDKLEITNLNRNAHSKFSQIGKSKVSSMIEFLNDASPGTSFEGINEMITSQNSQRLLENLDIVIVGVDNMCSRIIAHRATRTMKIPTISMSGGPPYRAYVSVLFPTDVEYEELFNLPTRGESLDLAEENLKKIHHDIRKARVKFSMKNGAISSWGDEYLSGNRTVWPITPNRVYLTSTLSVHEAVNFVLDKPILARAPKIIHIDLNSPPNIVSIKTPPNESLWNYEVW